TDGAGEMTFLRRSTVPPSRSTHRNIGSEVVACESRSSFQVWVGDSMLRANRITPAGCSGLSVMRNRLSISTPSKPKMSNWPTWRCRSAVVFLGIALDYTELLAQFFLDPRYMPCSSADGP